MARAVRDSTVCGLARALDRDIDRAGEALKDAAASRIHTFIATSPIHMKMKLRMEPDQVLEQAVKAVTRARKYTDNVEFSPEDAGRSELDFLCRVLEAVIDAGRHHGEYPRHGRLQPPAPVRRADQDTSSSACRTPTRRCSRCTVITTSAWPWPTRCRRC